MEQFLIEHINKGQLGLNFHLPKRHKIELVYLGKDDGKFFKQAAQLAAQFAEKHGEGTVQVSRVSPNVFVAVAGKKVRNLIGKLAAACKSKNP